MRVEGYKVRLITDIESIQDRYSFNPVTQLLFTNIRRDSAKYVIPILVQKGSETFLLARQQELGNLLSSGLELKDLKLYDPWVTIDSRITEGIEVSSNFGDAVSALADGDQVELDQGVTLVHYQALRDRVDVTVDEPAPQPVRVYELSGDAILDKFRAVREDGVTAAGKLISKVEHLKGLEGELTFEVDTRFEGLDALAQRLDTDGFLLASPPNFSEVSGHAHVEGCVVFWQKRENRVLLIGPADRFDLPGVPLSRYESLAEAVADLMAGTRLGVEEQWIAAHLGIQLERAGLSVVNSSLALGHWRDIRDHEDLGFQIIAARASVECIEDALDFAQAQISSGNALTENDVYGKYLELLHSFRADNAIPFSIEPYFTNLHSSTRMLFPGPPTNFRLDSETKCIQLDAGVQVVVDGVVMATSDMARSLLLTPQGKEAYLLFTDIVREGIIGQLRPGIVCADVHKGTMTAVTKIRGQLEKLGMLAEGLDFITEYEKRNVGHLMGKQESFANEFRPGYGHELTVGSLGAAEIPWRFGDHAIGTEDMWYVGKNKTYITTLR